MLPRSVECSRTQFMAASRPKREVIDIVNAEYLAGKSHFKKHDVLQNFKTKYWTQLFLRKTFSEVYIQRRLILVRVIHSSNAKEL